MVENVSQQYWISNLDYEYTASSESDEERYTPGTVARKLKVSVGL